MTKEQAISAIYRGELIECEVEQYPEIRTAIQEQAGKWAAIALQEVKRLDTKFNQD
jgi:hypothetical protein